MMRGTLRGAGCRPASWKCRSRIRTISPARSGQRTAAALNFSRRLPRSGASASVGPGGSSAFSPPMRLPPRGARLAHHLFHFLLQDRRIGGDAGIDDQVGLLHLAAPRQRQRRRSGRMHQIGDAEESLPKPDRFQMRDLGPGPLQRFLDAADHVEQKMIEIERLRALSGERWCSASRAPLHRRRRCRNRCRELRGRNCLVD